MNRIFTRHQLISYAILTDPRYVDYIEWLDYDWMDWVEWGRINGN